jgi:DNA-binding beta-propeller fold protein YncE
MLRFFGVLACALAFGFTQDSGPQVVRFPIGTSSGPAGAEVTLTLIHRFQQYNWKPKDPHDVLDNSIHSPKSVRFSEDGRKMYVQSLEGNSTSVYSVGTWKRTKVIRHQFGPAQAPLFAGETTVFDYAYRNRSSNHNIFTGKPVESCLSHNGRYLWVTYYRRNYDPNAESPSAVAIIDTQADSIVRVMPTGPLPKMIASSPDNRWVAVTHWGDNTVGLIDISSNDYREFRYVKHFVVDYRAELDFDSGVKIDRDQNCGFCLRGTVFTPDSKYLLVGRMGGGGIAVFDVSAQQALGTMTGMANNVRHLAQRNGELYLGCNNAGVVQRTALSGFLSARLASPGKSATFSDWKSVHVGTGVRTIEVTRDGRYIFACVNNKSKVAVVRSADMKVVAEVGADSFPVGMALSPDERFLAVTAQGRDNGGGNSVMIYSIAY